ncbi:MAG: C25 family cysteine peptidase [Saprospiraceae bacterium]|nr:C25 family cysteine peptidase [Saprospiraceae bacterium]
MKRAIIYLIVLFFINGFFSTLFGQGHDGKFGNEWIDYTPGKQYYKIKIFQDGMYRVSSAVLQQAGANISAINLNGIQLFHEGNEVPIHVESSSGVLDYVQFYGKKNTGAYDVNMYNDPEHHFNEHYSLFNDTAAYFLTWGSAPSNKYFTTIGANLSSLPPSEQYFMQRKSVVFYDTWNKGLTHHIQTENLSKSIFEYGEGFGTSYLKTKTASFDTDHPFTSGPDALAEVKVFTPGVNGHSLTIKIGSTTYASHNFTQKIVGKFSANIPASDILTGTTDITARGNYNAVDNYYFAYFNLIYPRTFDFDGSSIYPLTIEASPNRKYLILNDFDLTNSSQNKYYLYDLTNSVRIQCLFDGANSRVLTDLDSSSFERELVLINEGNPNSFYDVVGVTPVSFRNFDAWPLTNYIIVTHASLYNNSTGGDPITDYIAYRQSNAGGNHIVTDVDVQELYDQFSYGITYHPLAIRHFGHYIKTKWQNPEYIFLIGKGRNYSNVRGVPSSLLVPTFGYPPSDHVLMGSINTDEPTIAVGRLSALNGDQVSLYLNKIKDMESEQAAAQTLLDKGWTKNVLHLGGGKNSNEQIIIRNHLDAMKTTIEAPSFGGNVQSFFKSSTNPIQVVQSEYLDSLINSGVSMLTFFGHSSANSFDFNLDHPENYTNYKKYPLIMALGCYGGTLFEATPFISEDFIFEPNAGAGVFIASGGATALSSLNIFAQYFYQSISTQHYNEGAAKSIKRSINIIENNFFSNINQMACNYMTYHGDPAFRLSNNSGPDYYIDETLVSHSPEVVTVQLGTFNLELDVYNIGKAIDTVFNITVERIYPDGTTAFVTSQQVDPAPLFLSNITIPVPTGNATALGINKFNIYIDSDNDVDESPLPSAENNNSVIEYVIPILSDDVVPVHPYEFAIVPHTPVVLQASTGNTFAVVQTYVMQIDTTENFDSPLMKDTMISQIGGLLEWTPSINYMDSVVYYWRVSPDSVSPTSGYYWANSSFIYLDGSYPGWNQSHYFQFLKDKHTNLYIDSVDRNFKYISSIQTVSISTGKTPSVMHPENLAIYFNGSKLDKCRCSSENGVYVSVIEPGTLNFWELSGPFNNQKYGAFNCDGAGRTTPMFLFKTQTAQGRDALENFIRDTIPVGHYVIAFTLNNAYGFLWDSLTLRQAFKDQGALYIDDFATNSSPADGLQWATFFKKGVSSYVHNASIIGATPNTKINLDGSLEENWYQGHQTSTIIGPASYWGSMEWDHDNLPDDEVYVNVYGIDANQNVRTPIITQSTNLINSLTGIDPNQYPYLELVWNSLDSINNTSPQLKFWRVLGDMVPEAALRPDMFLIFDSTTVQQGQKVTMRVAMENISTIDMDSMLVKFEIVGTNQKVYQRLDSLRSGDTLHAFVTFPTIDLQGSTYQLLVEINPDNDQPEKHFFNNIGLMSFLVKKDIINPLLDVTFDGVHIMNKDIVSGQPEIVIMLSDENEYLVLDELDDFSIILRHSSFSNGEMALTPANTDLQFYPSDPSKLGVENKAKLILHPDFVEDGIYTLFVSAADKSGNNSGQMSYSVDFEVINKPSISHLVNYPNPFSTSTQFVFTLTGRELPNYMKIQILTITGKVVREITQEELGTLRIGINRTEYAWDGKDEYGDQLANGVYLYRVITKRDGADYDIYSNRTDYMFRQGFGKMYLMR